MDAQGALLIQIGITVVLVAAVISTIFNLLKLSQTIQGTGLSRLSTGVSNFTTAHLTAFDNSVKLGMEINTLLQTASSDKIAVLVQTNATRKILGDDVYINYGALVEGNTKSGTGLDVVYKVKKSNSPGGGIYREDGSSRYLIEKITENGVASINSQIKNTRQDSHMEKVAEHGDFYSELGENISGDITVVVATQLEY